MIKYICTSSFELTVDNCSQLVGRLGAPWRIGTLKYLEVKIEEWPSRDKWGQSGPNRAKWCQMVPNGAKQGHTELHGVKRGQKGPTEPNGAKRANRAKRGQMGSYGADFLHARIFL